MTSSEEIHTTRRDKLPVFEALVAERLRPTVTKEMGFQSYEMLEGDAEYRKGQQAAFFAGELRNPVLDYPKIDTDELFLKTIPLEIVIDQAGHMSDPEAAKAVQTSAAYHQIEMYWLMKAKKLDDLKDDPTSSLFLETARSYQELNEILYGAPREDIAKMVYGEIVAQGIEKELAPGVQNIYDELLNGAVVTIGDENVAIPGLKNKGEGRLPVIGKETLSDLGEVLRDKFGYVYEVTQKYWDEVILPRGAEAGEELGFGVQDMKVVFDQVREIMDPNDDAKIGVQVMPNKTALSWDTPTMTVQIGEKRAAITGSDEDGTAAEAMASKIIHELAKHGGGAINGLKSELPVLGTGLYTDAAPGKNASYLTFEEGFASLAEIAATRADTIKWSPIYISRYLAALSQYEGADFRQTYEVNWRARVVVAAKDGVEMTESQIAFQKKQAYLSVVRITRGTPTELVDGPVLTFNKDLAYLEGKIIALEYLDSVKGNKKAIERLFTAKFDPTNPIQDALVDTYGIKDNG